MSRFSILLGGDIVRTPRLAAQLAGTRVIAADSGIRHADALGLTPELWLGDFDSVSSQTIERHPAIPRRIFARDKDFTDGELAIRAAREAGATALVLVGAFGGPRADHAFLHLAQAVSLAEEGLSLLLVDGRQEGLPLLPGSHRFDYEDGTMFSVLAFEDLAGLSVAGAKWPLDDIVLPFGASLTLSNEVCGALCVTLRQGRAILVAHLAERAKG